MVGTNIRVRNSMDHFMAPLAAVTEVKRGAGHAGGGAVPLQRGSRICSEIEFEIARRVGSASEGQKRCEQEQAA
jgi:hypothetical protein